MFRSASDVTSFQFGPFRLDAGIGILFCGSEPTALGQRGVTLLRLLIENAGTPVSKKALIEAAWPGLIVEDSNLTVQLAALRRVLEEGAAGANWIVTLSRRGYRYCGPQVVTQSLAGAPHPAESPTLTLPEKPSVAVLAFSNLSGDSAQDYLADGMVEDIVAGLARIKGLFVGARSSSFAYRGRTVDPRRIGRELGVRYLLLGSFRQASRRVRVSAQLIEAESGGHLWAERYDRSLDDVFALQDEIALSVVGAIEPSLRRAEIERVRRLRPESLGAYDLVLQSQDDVDSGMPNRVSKALVLLQRALALEPTYALAHAYAAMCHHCLFLRCGLREVDRAESLRHASAAIAYGQDDALALTFAGFSLGMDGHDRDAAFAAFEAALAISPSTALAYVFGSVISGWGAEAERAIDWSARARRLSPFDSWTFAALHATTLGHFHRGRFEEAAGAARMAIQTNPGHSISYMLLAACLARLGRSEEAAAAAASVMKLQPTFRYSRQFSGVACEATLAKNLGDALQRTGLPC